MSKLKGLKKLTKVVNDFTVKNFGVTAEFGDEFEALPSEKLIHFTIIVDEDMQAATIDDMEARFPLIQTDMFFWLLMHEVGHCMTENIWDDDDNAYFEYMKNRLSDYFDGDVIAKNEWYHIICDEYFATKWAGCYMMEHPKKMRKFAKRFHEAYIKFIEKNAITA